MVFPWFFFYFFHLSIPDFIPQQTHTLLAKPIHFLFFPFTHRGVQHPKQIFIPFYFSLIGTEISPPVSPGSPGFFLQQPWNINDFSEELGALPPAPRGRHRVLCKLFNGNNFLNQSNLHFPISNSISKHQSLIKGFTTRSLRLLWSSPAVALSSVEYFIFKITRICSALLLCGNRTLTDAKFIFKLGWRLEKHI